jgi:hypothetical protein
MHKDDDLDSIDLLLSSPRGKDDDEDEDDDATIDPTEPCATTLCVTVPGASVASKKSSYFPNIVSRDRQQQSSLSPIMSPATQTLNTLVESQQSADLQLSQLEYDVVHTLAEASRRKHHISDKPPSCKQSKKKKSKTVAFMPGNPADDSSTKHGMTKNDGRKQKEDKRREIQRVSATTSRCVNGADDKLIETKQTNAKNLGISGRESVRFSASTGNHTQDCTTTKKHDKTSGKIGNSQPVEEVDPVTGQVLRTYPSSAAAARETGIHPSSISHAVTGRIPNYQGRIFRRCNQDSRKAYQDNLGQQLHEKKRSGHDSTTDERKNSNQRETQTSRTTNKEEKTKASQLKVKEKRNPRKSKLSSTVDGETAQLTEIFCDGSFQVLRFHIKDDGPLGLSIAAATPTDKTLAFIRQLDGIRIPIDEQCTLKMVQISGLKTPSCIGADAGLKKFDWLLIEKWREDGRRSFEFEYKIVRDTAKRGIRPVTFIAIRCLHVASSHRDLCKLSDDIDFQSSPPRSKIVESKSHSGKNYYQQLQSDNFDKETDARTGNENIYNKAVELMTKSPIVTKESETANQSRGSPQNRRADASTSKMHTGHCFEAQKSNPRDSATERIQESMIVEDDESVEHLGPKTSLSPHQVPFCSYCNGRATNAVHHAWCPKNKQFLTSGADKVLNRIHLGVRLGCTACKKEFQKGRSVAEIEHSKNCHIHQKDTLLGKKKSSNKYSEKSSDIGKGSMPKVSLDSDESKQSDGSDGVSDDESAYQNPSRLCVSSRKIVILSKKSDGTNETSKNTNKKRKSSIIDGRLTKRKKKDERLDVDSGIVKQRETLQAASDKLEVDLLPDDKLTSNWEDCVDPWGPEGQAEDDITVYNDAKAFCHHERIVPSARFEIDPFTSSSRYRKTHYTPEEGFQAIVLQRDPLAQRPWGFTWKRHEFGGACLVNSVEPLSPAEAAVCSILCTSCP